MTTRFTKIVGLLFEIAALFWFIGAFALPDQAFIPFGACFVLMGSVFLLYRDE